MANTVYDLILVAFALTSLFLSNNYYYKLSGIFRAASNDSHSSSDSSGFHLLSCPHLFDKQQTEMNDLVLTRQSAEKLHSILSSSMSHASVLKTDKDHHMQGLQHTISEAVAKQTGNEGANVDVNIPKKLDNKEACKALKMILEEEKKQRKQRVDNEKPSESEVSISILQLDNSQSGSLLLRGARLLSKNVLLKLKSIAHFVTDTAVKDAAYFV